MLPTDEEDNAPLIRNDVEGTILFLFENLKLNQIYTGSSFTITESLLSN